MVEANKLDANKSKILLLNTRLNLAILLGEHDAQATLIVCILRHYISTKSYVTAAKFIETVKFPESARDADTARYFYYQGRIKVLYNNLH